MVCLQEVVFRWSVVEDAICTIGLVVNQRFLVVEVANRLLGLAGEVNIFRLAYCLQTVSIWEKTKQFRGLFTLGNIRVWADQRWPSRSHSQLS